MAVMAIKQGRVVGFVVDYKGTDRVWPHGFKELIQKYGPGGFDECDVEVPDEFRRQRMVAAYDPNSSQRMVAALDPDTGEQEQPSYRYDVFQMAMTHLSSASQQVVTSHFAALNNLNYIAYLKSVLAANMLDLKDADGKPILGMLDEPDTQSVKDYTPDG
jgi:hypothetical protein